FSVAPAPPEFFTLSLRRSSDLSGAHVLALVGALDPAGLADGVHGDDGLFVGEQDPVPVGLRQVAPGPVDVVAEGGEDVAEVLALDRKSTRLNSSHRISSYAFCC